METANEPAAEDSQTEASRSESSSPQFEATEEEVIWPEHSALMKKTELVSGRFILWFDRNTDLFFSLCSSQKISKRFYKRLRLKRLKII